jgi:chromosome segregation ATPase
LQTQRLVLDYKVEVQTLQDKKHQLSLFKVNLEQSDQAIQPAIKQLLHQLESDEYTLDFLKTQLKALDEKTKSEQDQVNTNIAHYQKLIEEAGVKLKSVQQRKSQADGAIGELHTHCKVLKKEIVSVTNNINLKNKYLLFLEQMHFQLNNMESIHDEYHKRPKSPGSGQQQLQKQPSVDQQHQIITPKINNAANLLHSSTASEISQSHDIYGHIVDQGIVDWDNGETLF